MERIYDLIIIGAGPAGLSAAIYAGRARLDTMLIEKEFSEGGQILNTYEVDNYPGLSKITGMELGEALRSHAQDAGIRFSRAYVEKISREGAIHKVETDQGIYRARTVLLATGARHRKLEIPGEEELTGMGVSYCATCDGAFFKDLTAVVVGGGNVAVEDAIFLSRICKKVYLVHRRDQLRADRILQEHLMAAENIRIIWNSTVEEILGEDKVEAVKVFHKDKKEEEILPVQGIFIAVGILPNTDSFKDIVETDEGGYIVAGEEGITSCPGIFAAGDLRTKQLRQVVTAASDGANAVTSIQHYLLREFDK